MLEYQGWNSRGDARLPHDGERTNMARFQYVILSRAEAGREAEFAAWYDGVHLADVARVEGVVSARRYPIRWISAETVDAPPWRSLAIYEIESDDPDTVIARIAEASGSIAMPISEALSMDGLVQILTGPESGRG